MGYALEATAAARPPAARVPPSSPRWGRGENLPRVTLQEERTSLFIRTGADLEGLGGPFSAYWSPVAPPPADGACRRSGAQRRAVGPGGAAGARGGSGPPPRPRSSLPLQRRRGRRHVAAGPGVALSRCRCLSRSLEEIYWLALAKPRLSNPSCCAPWWNPEGGNVTPSGSGATLVFQPSNHRYSVGNCRVTAICFGKLAMFGARDRLPS